MPTATTNFNQAFEQRNQQGSPDWLTGLRTKGFTRFSSEGFPTRKNEEYKYTNLKPIQNRSFRLLDEPKSADLAAYSDLFNQDHLELVFVDGVFAPEHSRFADLPAGLTLCPLHQAIAQDNAAVKEMLTRNWPNAQETFTDLNDAFLRDGLFLHLADNSICQPLIHMVNIYTGQNPDIMVFPRNLIAIGQSSEACVLESHISRASDAIYFTNNLTDIFVAENAKLGYYKAQVDSLAAFDISTTRVHQAANSRLFSFCLTTGGALVRNNLSITLDGPGIESNLDGLYAIYGQQHVDNHTQVDHRHRDCVSSQLYKGILNDKARAVFNGKIFVRQPAQKTNAYQLNRNLLLSPNAEIDTKPQLEINADDVKCTHGATIGQMDKNEIFYLQSRGLAKHQAINMLAHGFAEDVLAQIKNETIHTAFSAYLSDFFVNAGEQ
jgi:Fe-S cluster assembly protein SufD